MFVSVIIPVYDDPASLAACLDRLQRQTYDTNQFEILVVDNGSPQPMTLPAEGPANAAVIREAKPGSYAARNAGLSSAKGSVLAFTDADCLAEPEWIERGVRALNAVGRPGLIAGRIDVFFKDPKEPTWVELYEQEFAFLQKENTALRQYGATANLFVSRAVFDAVGMFDAALKSGGDREFGNRAVAAGFPLDYADDVRVLHPARRTTAEYFAKLRRTVRGHYDLRHQPDKQDLFRVPRILRNFIPPRNVFAQIGQSGAPLTPVQKLKIAGFVMTSRYYTNLLRLKLALFPNAYSETR